MSWISVNNALPQLSKPTWAWSATKGGIAAKMVKGSNGDVFIDHNAMPIRDVIFWQYQVAPNETDAL